MTNTFKPLKEKIEFKKKIDKVAEKCNKKLVDLYVKKTQYRLIYN